MTCEVLDIRNDRSPSIPIRRCWISSAETPEQPINSTATPSGTTSDGFGSDARSRIATQQRT